MGMVHRVWGYVSDEEFYRMLRRARLENCFVDDKGMVDIAALIQKLVSTYGDGRYCILPTNHSHSEQRVCNDKDKADRDAHYVAASAAMASVEAEPKQEPEPQQEAVEEGKPVKKAKKKSEKTAKN
jgi:hypothetical protein